MSAAADPSLPGVAAPVSVTVLPPEAMAALVCADTVGVNAVRCAIAAEASSRPAPQRRSPIALSQQKVPIGKAREDDFRMVSTPSGVSVGMAAMSNAAAPETWAAATLVPASANTSCASVAGVVVPVLSVDQSSRQMVLGVDAVPCAKQDADGNVNCAQLPPPGALMSVPGPQLAVLIRSPSTVCEVTAMTPEQLAGEPMLDMLSLPVATTTTDPAARAASIALCSVESLGQEPTPLRLRLMTRAGAALSGRPIAAHVVPPGGAPEAQRMASATSTMKPLHLPSTRTGSTFDS